MWAGVIPAPVHPPAVYLTDDWMIQTHSPALFYNISGEMTDSVANATTPVGLIWKVEPSNSTEVLYYATVSSSCKRFTHHFLVVDIVHETISFAAYSHHCSISDTPLIKAVAHRRLKMSIIYSPITTMVEWQVTWGLCSFANLQTFHTHSLMPVVIQDSHHLQLCAFLVSL